MYYFVLFTAVVVLIWPILVTLMEVILFSETSLLTIATWRNILADDIL
jgi:hypothetical protein